MGSHSGTWIFGLALLRLLSSAQGANNYNCDDPLVAALPLSSFESSSRSFNNQSPQFAKLNRRDGGGGWSPLGTDLLPWLQLDLRDRVEVTGIATQGRWGSSDWVRQFQLQYSDSGRTWRQYRQDEVLWSFQGNMDADSVVHHKLPYAIRTRFLRLVHLEGNPNGGVGLRVEVYGCTYKSDVADFDGRSALLYRFNQKSTSTVKDVISLRFRSRLAEGVLVHGAGQRGDYIILELQRARLVLQLNLDDAKPHSSGGHSSVTLGSLLDDYHWHSVLIERFNKQVNFTVDRHTLHFRTQGQEDSLEVDYELSFGGIPLPGKPGTFLKENFLGCMENLYYNGMNVIDLAKRRKPQIYSVGNVTFSCSESQPVSLTFLSSSDSFLAFPSELGTEDLSLRVQFRTWNRDGLVLSAPLSHEPKHLTLLLQLHEGRLHLSLHGTPDDSSQASVGHGLNDGQWHSLELDVKGQQVTLTVDNQKSVAMEIKHRGNSIEKVAHLFLGGCPVSPNDLGCENPSLGFQGCMRLIFINNHPLNLLRVQQGNLCNYSQLGFDVCSIRDRCLSNFCEHGGRCYQSWSHFYCNCSGTGYTGATCHNPIYERSCEAYRKTGRPSGVFSIDPDGSGPLENTQVDCSMAEDRMWTVVGHDHTQPVRVRGSTPQSPYILVFDYAISPHHLRHLVAVSQHCQQEVIYRCRRSRLFDTWDGTPLSWWMDRDGVKRTYWGGFLPGVQQCSCSLEGNCIDMNYFCNCDADRDTWVNDTGLLSYKDHLPLSEIAIGDTNRTDAEAVFRIGPLRCYGDRFVWNTASFYQESSSLHFPTLQAELSVDLSLYFKTSAPSGVFLENLGVRDFIRMELSSPSAVTFTFDLGNGPVVLAVRSPVPLNDRQWHYVRAERNLKEASLQVDQLPARLLEAPSEGHFRLQLNSQLFVGGTASRQKGFSGCLRALTLNGLTLDLNERAKTTPGVTPGCPGYCNSDSLCQNGGRCVEERSGYTCDCSQSAYGVPHCRTDVSASFESGSSISYTFQEPFSVMLKEDRKQSPGTHDDISKSRENVAFGFRTRHTPALLLTALAHNQHYMAIILAHNGSLQIRYRLNEERGPDVFCPTSGNLADGQLHWIWIKREGHDVYIQIDNNLTQRYSLSPGSALIPMRTVTLGKIKGSDVLDEEVAQAGLKGFVGCLSSVQFNQAAPLKVALQNHGSSLVSLRGHVVKSSCGASTSTNTLTTTHSLTDDSAKTDRGKEPLKKATQNDSALIGGVVATVVFITLCAVAVTTHFLYRHRRSPAPSAITEKDHRQSLENPYRTELDLHKSARDSKEYFI